MKNKITQLVFDFFINSHDYNGIPLRQISEELELKYENSIDLIKELIGENILSIQSSTNPHIIGFTHHEIDAQLKILEAAKNITVSKSQFGDFEISTENTEYPICVYPSQNYLKENRDTSIFANAPYTSELALGEGQLSFRFFELEVLERYSQDPRFDFKFYDFSGSISCKYDENGEPIIREEDQIFIKSFGLGFDVNEDRIIAVLLCDLGKMVAESQFYWKTKEIEREHCKVLAEYYENQINGDCITSHSVFSGFIGELNAIYKTTEKIYGIPLFRKYYGEDNWPINFTFFFSPTLKNYYDFVNLLDKYLSENINLNFFKKEFEIFEEKEIENGIVERNQKGTLRLLEEWLNRTFKFQIEDAVNQMMEALKKVRKERQTPAHKIITNEYDKTLHRKQKDMIQNCYFVLHSIRKILEKHPSLEESFAAEWLDDGSIKAF